MKYEEQVDKITHFENRYSDNILIEITNFIIHIDYTKEKLLVMSLIVYRRKNSLLRRNKK